MEAIETTKKPPTPQGGVKRVFKIAVLLLLALIIFTILNPIVIITAGHRGVVLTWGAVSDRVLGEGIHLRIPIMQKVAVIDVQTHKMNVDTLAYSKDIQTVTSKLALNYHVKPELVNRLWQNVGEDYVSRLIDPAVQESVKAATAKFTAQQLIEERPKVKDAIKQELFARLSAYFNVDEFSIVDFTFSKEYERAVEEKQVAQQQALKAENDLTRIKTEAEQRIAQATAEAEAIRIQAQAITQQGGRDYVQLKAIEKWNGELPQQMIPGSTVPFLNLRDEMSDKR
jgi:regulator of protease activity HflC (stomatin/prohibitin superfamily)